jgi:hypothetical protein
MRVKIIALLYGVIFITLQATIVEAWDEPPTAKIVVADQTVAIGKQIWFDGYQSTDNDENGERIVAWEWSLPSAAYDISGENSPYLCCRFDDIGDYTVTLKVTDDEGSTDQKSIRITVIKPYEETLPGKWDSDPDWVTSYLWWMRATPLNEDFSHLEVYERDYAKPYDGCYFKNSAIPYNPGCSVAGGTWSIRPGNGYGFDAVGWKKDAVLYYRSHSRAPCNFTSFQEMVARLPETSKELPYARNTLKGLIENQRVGSQRGYSNGVPNIVWKNWP